MDTGLNVRWRKQMYTHIPSSIFKTSPWPCVCTLLHVYRTPSVFVLEKVWEKVKRSCCETPPHSKESFLLRWFQWFKKSIPQKTFNSSNSYQRSVKNRSNQISDQLMTFWFHVHTSGAIWTTLLSSCMTKRQPQPWIKHSIVEFCVLPIGSSAIRMRDSKQLELWDESSVTDPSCCCSSTLVGDHI